MVGEYKRGTVESYDDRAGYGYVVPDEPTQTGQRLLVHRQSMRRKDLLLEAGDRVIYRAEIVPRGVLATDVHLENAKMDDGEDHSEAIDGCSGRIAFVNVVRGYGFIDGAVEKRIFFHFSQLPNPDIPPAVGTNVLFDLRKNERSFYAEAIGIADDGSAGTRGGGMDIAGERSQNLLAQAILARDARDLDGAARLYRRGMRESPSVQLITSYAAMEKNRNRRQDAMSIYEQGLRIYPNNLKLCEDAGLLAASIGEYQKAIQLLNHGLELSEGSGQGVGRLFLLALARVHSRRGGMSDLQKCLEYYQRAKRAFDASAFGKGAFPKDDLLAMNLAAVRLQHYRGNLVFEYINRVGFRILRVQLFEQTTVGADFVVQVRNPELVESYGITGNLLVRCMFKSDITLGDVESLDSAVDSWGANGLIDDQVSLMIVASLPLDVERLLFRRIEERRRTASAIVPLTQSQIETAEDAMAALRQVLDRWLYRRDLFAQNFPVSGRRFFGRDKPLADLRDAIANGIAAGIFGLRKVGKTSLLKEIDRRSSEGGDIVIYMDLLRVPADVTDTRWIYWKLGAELFERIQRSNVRGVNWRIGGRYSDFFDIPAEFPVATAFDSDVTQVLGALRKSGLDPRPRLVLMLDEIERLLPGSLGKEGFVGFFDFMSYLRGLAQESDDFVPIITGANAAVAEAAQFQGRDNPIFNFFREIYLPLLQPGETALMIRTLGRGMGIRFSADACDRVHNLCGGHPFFARQFCSFLAERYPDRPLNVPVDIVESLVSPYLEIASKDFQEIVDRFARDYPEELDVCVAVANAGGTMDLESLTKLGRGHVSLRHLLGYQVVAMEGTNLRLTMDLMRLWLDRGGLTMRQ